MSAEKISYDLKRFAGIKRDYTPEEVERLRGSIKIEYSICKQQSTKLWKLLNTENEAQIIKKEDLDQHNSRGIYMRDDHCDWGSSGMSELIKALDDSN